MCNLPLSLEVRHYLGIWGLLGQLHNVLQQMSSEITFFSVNHWTKILHSLLQQAEIEITI